MARFSRVDLEKNLSNQIVPLNEYWLAIDSNRYVLGDGNTAFKDLTKYTYTGQIIDVDPNFVIDPTNDVSLDGGDLG